MLQMHNGSNPQCCHAASAYRLLTYFHAKDGPKGLWDDELCHFDEITAGHAGYSGGSRTNRADFVKGRTSDFSDRPQASNGSMTE
jgi:hypothetical protein